MALFGASGSASLSTTDSKSSGNSSENAIVRRLNSEDEAFVQQLVRQFSGGAAADLGAARKQALTDVKGGVDALFAEYKDTALPQIMGKQAQTGGYGSTTAQMLTNDAYARTVAQGQKLAIDAVTQYENTALAKSGQAMQGLGLSLQSLLQAQQTSDTKSKFDTRSSATTKSASGSFKFGV
jgi:hypothetical protein